jgi:D-alanyl-D-alanine carboxypeptidase
MQEFEAVRSVALHADTPILGLQWEGAVGTADPDIGLPMTPRTPSRIASNTKTFVAAAVLRLSEEDKLDVDGPIAEHLPGDLAAMLEGDGYDTGAITIRHLLTHTSGLFDHTSSDRYLEAIMTDPYHRWTRAEQVEGAVEWGDPYGPPGEFYSYCDTGYVLLGAIIEEAAGLPMAVAVRELVDFDRLGLISTWWETLEPRPSWVPERAHQFLGDIDTADFDPSYDLYGGGGLVSTVGDLARFYRALFEGDVFDSLVTGSTMTKYVGGVKAPPGASDRALPPGAYRMGVWVTDIEGFATLMHTGFFGTLAAYVPDLDMVVTVATNQNRDGGALNEINRRVVRAVAGFRADEYP